MTVEMLKSYYPLVVALIGTVGAQMTSAVAVADLSDTKSDVLDKEDVRKLMVASWFMFFTLIFSGFASGLLGLLNQQKLHDGWFRRHRRLLLLALIYNVTMIGVGFAAFGCMAAAMAAYTNVGVGGFAAWYIGGGYLIAVLTTIWQLAALRKGKCFRSNSRQHSSRLGLIICKS